MANSFSDFFSDRILDNNGISVTDINAGLHKLIPSLIDDLNNVRNDYNTFVNNADLVGQPDAAAQFFYKNDSLWWYILLANKIENPFEEFDDKHIFVAFDTKYLSKKSDEVISEIDNTTNNESKIGNIIVLN